MPFQPVAPVIYAQAAIKIIIICNPPADMARSEVANLKATLRPNARPGVYACRLNSASSEPAITNKLPKVRFMARMCDGSLSAPSTRAASAV